MAAEPASFWLTLLAGLGIGSIAASFIGWFSAKAITISNHRQNWINALREDIVVFLQEVDKMSHAMSMAMTSSDPSKKVTEPESIRTARDSARLVYRRILLRLNMTEPLHIKLGELLKAQLTIREPSKDTRACLQLSRMITQAS